MSRPTTMPPRTGTRNSVQLPSRPKRPPSHWKAPRLARSISRLNSQTPAPLSTPSTTPIPPSISDSVGKPREIHPFTVDFSLFILVQCSIALVAAHSGDDLEKPRHYPAGLVQRVAE